LLDILAYLLQATSQRRKDMHTRNRLLAGVLLGAVIALILIWTGAVR